MADLRALVHDTLNHVSTFCIDKWYLAGPIFIILSIFLYYQNYFRVWSKQGIKGPFPIPYFGNAFSNSSMNLMDRYKIYISKYGKIYGTYNGSNPSLTVADPKYLKKILIKDAMVFPDRGSSFQTDHEVTKLFLSSSRGALWQKLRTIMTPTFTSGKMKHMYPLMDQCIDLVRDNLNRKCLSDDNNIDVKHVFGCYTMDVIAKCCFATDTNSAAGGSESAIFVDNAKSFFLFSGWKFMIYNLVPKFILKLIGFELMSESKIRFFQNVSKELIKRRRAEANGSKNGGKSTSKDFLQLLLDSAKDKMTDDEIIANSIQFFVAGYETTASLLTFSCYALAVNPDVQDKLYEDVKTIAHDINYDNVFKLEYLDSFIKEALRVYPPALGTARVAAKDYWLTDEDDNSSKKGIFIPRGTSVSIPIYAIQNDPDYWDQPEIFNPDRFMPENRSKLVPYTQLAFGDGPRNCIGMRFALLEAKIALVKLILDFKFFKTSKTEIPLDFSGTLFMLTAKSVTVGVSRREK